MIGFFEILYSGEVVILKEKRGVVIRSGRNGVVCRNNRSFRLELYGISCLEFCIRFVFFVDFGGEWMRCGRFMFSEYL